MKLTSFIPVATAASIFAATAFTAAIAEPVCHFSVEGTYRVKAV